MKKQLKEIYTIDNAIFSDFETIAPDICQQLFPSYNSKDLDLLFLSYCGEKIASTIITVCLDDNGLLSEERRKQIARLMLSKYGDNWLKLRETLFAEYDSLSPYKMVTTETGNTDTDNTNIGADTTTSAVFGFDAETATDKDINTSENNTAFKGSVKNTRNTTVTGNLGNVASSDLIKKELDLRKTDYLTLVIDDLAHSLTLAIYF